VSPLEEQRILTAIFSRQPDVVPRAIAGETILVPVRGELARLQQIFVLNPVGEHIWHQLDGSRAFGAILQSLVEAFDIDDADARSDLLEFLAELEDAGLITPVGVSAELDT
jgi:Coenzyme PQQ synthesis protein D (PqqD)